MKCLAGDGGWGYSADTNYFINGRHTPLLIAVKGGSLSDESFDKLQKYMEDIKGESGQHAFIVLETEASDNRTGFTAETRPEIEIKDLAAILQRDELFQDYLANNRRKIQSSFLLPDLYTGYTTEFNRATAQTAMEITEKQVFQPERLRLAWKLNNQLLNCYNFRYVQAVFREPDVTNPDDLAKILNITERAGGLTPQKATDVTCDVLGETSEEIGASWAKIPLAVARVHNALAETAQNGPEIPAPVEGGNEDRGAKKASQNSAQAPTEAKVSLDEQLEQQILKATAEQQTEVVAVMKEIRKLLLKLDSREES